MGQILDGLNKFAATRVNGVLSTATFIVSSKVLLEQFVLTDDIWQCKIKNVDVSVSNQYPYSSLIGESKGSINDFDSCKYAELVPLVINNVENNKGTAVKIYFDKVLMAIPVESNSLMYCYDNPVSIKPNSYLINKDIETLWNYINTCEWPAP